MNLTVRPFNDKFTYERLQGYQPCRVVGEQQQTSEIMVKNDCR